MNTTEHLNQTENFRSATGLPLNASEYVFASSAACTIEEFTELADAMGDSIVTIAGIALQCTDQNIIDECIWKIENIRNAAKIVGIDIDAVMNKIYTANMSKLCNSIDEAVETQTAYLLDGVNSYIEPVGEYFAVYSEFNQTSISGKYFPSNKLLKNINWSEPDYFDIQEWFKDDHFVDILTKNIVKG